MLWTLVIPLQEQSQRPRAREAGVAASCVNAINGVPRVSAGTRTLGGRTRPSPSSAVRSGGYRAAGTPVGCPIPGCPKALPGRASSSGTSCFSGSIIQKSAALTKSMMENGIKGVL